MNCNTRRKVRTTALALAATMTFTGFGITAEATTSVLPGGGVSLIIDKGNKLEDIVTNNSTDRKSVV